MKITFGMTRTSKGSVKVAVLPSFDIFVVRPGWMVAFSWLWFYVQIARMP